jgi:hypothetical protein
MIVAFLMRANWSIKQIILLFKLLSFVKECMQDRLCHGLVPFTQSGGQYQEGLVSVHLYYGDGTGPNLLVVSMLLIL